MVKHSAAEREGISPRLLVSPAEERRAVTEGLLEGRTALVVGVANKRSIAWAIARRLDAAGARCALTFQGERTQRDVERLAGELGRPAPTMTLEVTDDGQADAAVAKAAQELGGIDILVHAVAFALAEDLGGRYVDTSLEGFRTALEISSYSLTALARRVEPHMRERGGGAIVTLSYRPRVDGPLPGLGPRRGRHPGERRLGGAGAHACGARHPRVHGDGRGGRRTLAAQA
jgi:hypothetical protein